MAKNRTRHLDWDPDIITLLAQVAPTDAQRAKVWWESVAPGLYDSLLDAYYAEELGGLLGPEDIPGYLKDNQDMLSDTQKSLLAAGLLFLFMGGAYYTARGGMVNPRGVSRAVSSTVASGATGTQDLCNRLREGRISLRTWQNTMAEQIILSNIAAGMAGGGGEDMPPQHFRMIQERIRFQLEKLDAFARRIAAGMPIDGTVCRLMKMYINSARGTFYAIEGTVMTGAGFVEYRNILSAHEAHCTGAGSCVEVTDAGWQPVGSLPPIGARKCMSNCLCHWQYRNPITGAVR